MNSKIITGDPFVDAGALAMGEVPGKTPLEKIEFALDIYVDKWSSKLNALFLNSPITQPSFGSQRKKKETVEQFQQMFAGDNFTGVGYCRACGHEGKLYPATRVNYPLSGSGNFINFHHSHDEGLLMCVDCLTRLFFLPLAVVQCGARPAIIEVRDDIARKFWLDDVVRVNLDQIARGTSSEILKKHIKNPRNALFDFAGKIAKQITQDTRWGGSLQLYHFTNFAAAPEIEIYRLPNTVFDFIAFALNHYRREWLGFVGSYFRIKQGEYDEKSATWFVTKKKKRESVSQQELPNFSNDIYNRLLEGRTITRKFFLRNERRVKLPFPLVLYYLIEVRNMRKEQVSAIQKLAHKIFDLTKAQNNFKKIVTPIEGARKPWELRSALLRAVKANFKRGNPEVLLTVEDYSEHLFPDGQNWSETRDVLLLCLYEEMHKNHLSPEQIGDSDIEEPDKNVEF